MFNSLKGIITEKRNDTLCLETAGGIEWLIEVSPSTLTVLPVVGKEARIYTWLLHREDQMRILGFSRVAERDLFEDLLSVNGVGPKGALKILSQIPAENLSACIESEDVDALSRVPGLGKKTAQKIILQLKGKLVAPADAGDTLSGTEAEILDALVAMGYDRKVARAVLSELLNQEENRIHIESGEEQLLMRKAIVLLSR